MLLLDWLLRVWECKREIISNAYRIYVAVCARIKFIFAEITVKYTKYFLLIRVLKYIEQIHFNRPFWIDTSDDCCCYLLSMDIQWIYEHWAVHTHTQTILHSHFQFIRSAHICSDNIYISHFEYFTTLRILSKASVTCHHQNASNLKDAVIHSLKSYLIKMIGFRFEWYLNILLKSIPYTS